MASDLDNLIKSLKRQRTDVETDMNSTREQDAADLVEKFKRLREHSDELDEDVSPSAEEAARFLALTSSFRNPV